MATLCWARRLAIRSLLWRFLRSSSDLSRVSALLVCRLLNGSPAWPLDALRLWLLETSATLCCLTLSISCRSSSSESEVSGETSTGSPGLYFFAISRLSCSDLACSGFAFSTISSNVVTVAFGLVARTAARHDGQVNRGAELDVRGRTACHENHSFRQEPQKVCRQSSKVRGWYNSSVQICIHIYQQW